MGSDQLQQPISARLIAELSPSELVRTMHNFGITSHLDPVMSLCLGPADVSVKEMVTAYTAFANKGMRSDPLFVTAIADAQGNIISEFAPRQTEVISEKAWYKMLSMLQNVVDGGTGNRIRRAPFNITAPTGGKTGTTNDNSDGWFMAFTPRSCRALGLAAMSAISTSMAWPLVRAPRWLFLSMAAS